MKKFSAIVIALLVVIMLIPFSAFAQEEVIEISTAQQLADINNDKDNLTKNYKLVEDIDLSEFNASWNGPCGGWNPIGWIGSDDVEFTGTLDGNLHKITGFTHDETSGVNSGLFSILGEGAVVKNLTIEGAFFRSGAMLGLIAGRNYGIIENCHIVNSEIYAAGVKDCDFDLPSPILQAPTYEEYMIQGCYCGGIAGMNFGDISYCSVKNSTISWKNQEELASGPYFGGIAGIQGPTAAGIREECASIANSYVENSFIGFENAADYGSFYMVSGIVGASWSYTRVENCAVANSKVYGLEFVGGITGHTQLYSRIIKSASWFTLVSHRNSPVFSVADPCVADATEDCEIDCYFAATTYVPDQGDGIHGVYEEEVLNGNQIGTLDMETWKYKKGTYPLPYGLYEEEEVQKYTVTFVDSITNEVISTCEVNEGEAAQAPAAPYHEGYLFKGWDSDFLRVNSDMTVMTVYEKLKFDVRFVDGMDGSTLKNETVEYGESATAPEAPQHDGYVFKGWDKDFTSVKENLVVTSIYEEIKEGETYTVTFVDGLTQEIISTVEVEAGKSAVAPEAPVHEGYRFVGFDKEFTNVQENITVTLMYEKITAGLRGDANVDNEVDSADATAVLRHVAKLDILEGQGLENADADLNGIVDSADATSILRFVAGLGW